MTDKIKIAQGQQIPNLTFLKPDGTEVQLSDISTGPLVLIFLRHLA